MLIYPNIVAYKTGAWLYLVLWTVIKANVDCRKAKKENINEVPLKNLYSSLYIISCKKFIGMQSVRFTDDVLKKPSLLSNACDTCQ